jgi:hypothetical protein
LKKVGRIVPSVFFEVLHHPLRARRHFGHLGALVGVDGATNDLRFGGFGLPRLLLDAPLLLNVQVDELFYYHAVIIS